MTATPLPAGLDSRLATDSILSVQGLSTSYFTRRGEVRAVRDVTFSLRRGETLGLVGESGSGKTATAMSILRMLPRTGTITGGAILLTGEDLMLRSEREMQRIRGRRIALVPQDPAASLNPLMTVGRHLTELLGVHLGLRGSTATNRAIDLLATVGISEPRRRFSAYPHQLSGGMRQRVMIALAIACEPSVLIADEPTTALDSTVQAQILELVAALSRDLNTSTILITHNLGVVAALCDRVAVMYGGRIVEMGERDEMFAASRHPYTRALLQCVPRIDRLAVAPFESIPGQAPDLIRPIPGCAFAPRCALATDRCSTELPPLVLAAENHAAACWNQDRLTGRPR